MAEETMETEYENPIEAAAARAAQALNGEPGETLEPDEVEPRAEEAGEEGSDDAGTPPPAATETPEEREERIRLAEGVEITADQAQGLAEFYTWAQQNPEKVQEIDAYLQGTYRLVPTEEPPSPPAAEEAKEEEEIDWDLLDPAVAKRLRRLEELEGQVSTLSQAQYQQQVAMSQSVIARAGANFAERYDLDEEALRRVYETTARLNILPGLAQTSGDTIAAVEEALETAYWRDPEFRKREIERQVLATATDEARKKKASALSGSSGSVPRKPPGDETPRDAMVREIAEAMKEGTIPSHQAEAQ